jgi:prepilin-type N-terminal cleavage/methylation domain-containing protein
MKKTTINFGSRGFTLTETSISLAVLTIVGGIAYSILMNSTTLLAKNVSLNSSNTTVRIALDRIYSEINQANGLPKLINADGTAAASASGPAAGIIFDRYLGGPYVVTNPGGSGLPVGTVSFQMRCATDPLALPPIPGSNDVVRIDSGATRPLVSICSPATYPIGPPPIQDLTITLKAPLSAQIRWASGLTQTAYLVHRKAFVVVSVNGRPELRMYGDAETTASQNPPASYYSDPANYVVLTREIGSQSGEDTPFSIVTQNGSDFLGVAMRVENQRYTTYLQSRYSATSQARDFNTFLRVDTILRPRNFLQ